MNIRTSERKSLKGIFLALLSAICFASVYIFSKAALNIVNFLQFGFYWFGLSLVLNVIMFFFLKLHKNIYQLHKRKKIILVVIGFFELLGTLLFFYSVKLLENPAIASFLTNSIPVFVVFLSFFFLAERFSMFEYIGIFTAITGILLLAYKPGIIKLSDFFDLGTALLLFASFIYAINTILIKKNIKEIHPLTISVVRGVLLFGFFVVSVLITGISLQISQEAMKYISLGAILGPVSGVLLSVYALRYVEASITSVLISTKSFITIFGTFLLFGLLPPKIQLIGGILSVAGIILISLGQHFKLKNKTVKL